MRDGTLFGRWALGVEVGLRAWYGVRVEIGMDARNTAEVREPLLGRSDCHTCMWQEPRIQRRAIRLIQGRRQEDPLVGDAGRRDKLC